MDDVPVPHQPDDAAIRRFRRNMPDGRTVGAAGEAAVRKQGHVFAQSHAGDGRRGGEHFTHARPAAGAFITDDHGIAGFNFAVQNGAHGVFFRFKHAGCDIAAHHFRRHGGLLHHRALRGQRAAQNGNAALLGVGFGHGMDDIFIQNTGVQLLQVVAHGLAGDSHALQIDAALTGQFRHDSGNAAGAVQVHHVILAGGGKLAQIRRLAAHSIKNIQGKVQTGFPEHRGQVQHGVGGAAQRHIHSHGIGHGFFRHNVQRADAALEHFHHLHTGLFGQADTGRAVSGGGAVAGQGHAHGFRQTVHGIGGEHARAGTAAGAGVFFQLGQRFFAHVPTAHAAHAFKHGDQVGLALGAVKAGHHGAAAHQHGRNVQAHHGHEHTGHALVAVRNEHQRVKGMRAGHDFNGIRNDFTRRQRKTHTFMIHGQPVAHGNGGKFQRSAAGHTHTGLGRLGQPIQMNVPGHHFIGRVDNAHQRTVNFLLGQPQSVQQRAVRGFLQPCFHFFAAGFHVHNTTFPVRE